MFRSLYPRAASHPIERAFADAARLYHGGHPRFHHCDTGYHDLQHVLDVTLAQARLMDGYERTRKGTTAAAADAVRARRDLRPVPRRRLRAAPRRQPPPQRRRVHAHPRIARRGIPAPVPARGRPGALCARSGGAGAFHRLRALGGGDPHRRPAPAPHRADARHRGHPGADGGPVLPGEMSRPPVPGARGGWRGAHPDPFRGRAGARNPGHLPAGHQAAGPAARARLRVRRAPLRRAEPVPRGDPQERAPRPRGRGRAGATSCCVARRPRRRSSALSSSASGGSTAGGRWTAP